MNNPFALPVLESNHVFKDGTKAFTTLQLANVCEAISKQYGLSCIGHEVMLKKALYLIDSHTLPTEQYYIVVEKNDEDIVEYAWLDVALLTRLASYLPAGLMPYITHAINVGMLGNNHMFATYLLEQQAPSAVIMPVKKPPLATMDYRDIVVNTSDRYYSADIITSVTGQRYADDVLMLSSATIKEPTYPVYGNETGKYMIQYTARTWEHAYGLDIT